MSYSIYVYPLHEEILGTRLSHLKGTFENRNDCQAVDLRPQVTSTAKSRISGTLLCGIRRYPDVLKKLKYWMIRSLQLRNQRSRGVEGDVAHTYICKTRKYENRLLKNESVGISSKAKVCRSHKKKLAA